MVYLLLFASFLWFGAGCGLTDGGNSSDPDKECRECCTENDGIVGGQCGDGEDPECWCEHDDGTLDRTICSADNCD